MEAESDCQGQVRAESECVSLVRALLLNLYKATSRIKSLVLGQVLSPVKFLLRHSLSAGCKLNILIVCQLQLSAIF